ncbi:MAG: HDOD domain-containing protein [Desulfobacteraceae bacterium]|nr:HDOD domain-containing protein [Desulfobacteraceae bacterium]
MKTILIANSDPNESSKQKEVLQRYFQVITIFKPEEIKKIKPDIDLLVLDSNFTNDSGIDFLKDYVDTLSPILMLTSDNDPTCAVEAIREGAFNYLVKTKNYLKIISITIQDAVNKYTEKQDLKDTIKDLLARLKGFEEQDGNNGKDGDPKSYKYLPDSEGDDSVPQQEINLVDEIITRFKKGEINLPTLPKICSQFNEMVQRGANIKEVGEFLKRDIAIASKLINVSNSALYQGIEKNINLENAIGRLGLGTTRQYVDIIANRSLYNANNPRFSALVEKLWKHSLACAFASEFIVELLHLRIDFDVFTLGLTHDIGKLILIQVIGELETKGKFVKKIDNSKLFKTLEAYHGRFGAVLMKRWGFTAAYTEVALYHDNLDKVKEPSKEFLCVHFTNLLVNTLEYNLIGRKKTDLEKSKSAYLLRLRPEEIELVRQKPLNTLTVLAQPCRY